MKFEIIIQPVSRKRRLKFLTSMGDTRAVLCPISTIGNLFEKFEVNSDNLIMRGDIEFDKDNFIFELQSDGIVYNGNILKGYIRFQYYRTYVEKRYWLWLVPTISVETNNHMSQGCEVPVIKTHTITIVNINDIKSLCFLDYYPPIEAFRGDLFESVLSRLFGEDVRVRSSNRDLDGLRRVKRITICDKVELDINHLSNREAVNIL